MENTSDYLMLGLLLICMRYDKKVCYKMWDYIATIADEIEETEDVVRQLMEKHKLKA